MLTEWFHLMGENREVTHETKQAELFDVAG
jgi:hypothetical protein